MRRLSSAEEEMDLAARDQKAEVAYYGQSPASLSSQTSWHSSDVEHGDWFFYHLYVSHFIITEYSDVSKRCSQHKIDEN